MASWGKDKRVRTAIALPKIKSVVGKAEGPQIVHIISEQLRRPMVEERRRERYRNEQKKEERRQLQIKRGNKRAPKKRGKERQAGHTTTAVSIGPFLSTVHTYQEDLFHAIDGLLKGLFAARRKSWTADTHHFRPPPNTPDLAPAWQLLSDRVTSVSMLIKGELYQHTNFMLSQVLAGLRDAARACDPSFIVHFWMICHVLAGIPVRRKGSRNASVWLGWFLRHLKQIFLDTFVEHPLVVIADSLLQVWISSPRDLKATLGLAHWKATHTLGDLIGHSHNIVLNMSACCVKSWKSKFSASSNLVDLLYQPLTAANANNLEEEQTAEVYRIYLDAATSAKYNDLDVIDKATRMLGWAKEICREKAHRRALRHDAVARLFIFCSELLATHHLETWKVPHQKQNKHQDHELSHKYMDEAIEILRCGDQQCRVRAASFSKRLSTWIKAHPQKTGNRPKEEVAEEEREKVLKEKVRMKEIVSHIAKEPIEKSLCKRRGPRRNLLRDRRVMVRNTLLESL
jgi:hypothetical protein